jgi:rod shape-determining protein MreD
MIKRLTLYTLLILAVATQLLLMTRTPWVPDLILIMVVFAGIFMGALEGLFAGLAAGLIRGLFSVDTLPIDILLFPAVGVFSSVLSNLFYRQNFANQVFLTFVALATVITVHTVYFNCAAANDINIFSAFFRSWRMVLVPLLFSPFVFDALRMLWQEED